MTEVLKILILEDSPYDAEEIMRRLELSAKFECGFRLAMNKATYLQALDEFCPSVILSDHSLPQFDSKEALTIARELFPDIPFIMVTGTISEEFAIDMIKAGVDDYILKDRMTRLPAAIIASVQKRKVETERRRLEKEREFDRNNLMALINNSNDLMWSVDLNLRLITSNEAFDRVIQNMTGTTVAKGCDILAEVFQPEQLARFRKYYERAFSGECFTEIEHTPLPDNIWSEISYCPIYSGDFVSGVACFSRDITQRKMVEKEIARAIIKTQEEERNYLGRELHDNVNQLLAAAKMLLSVAKHNIEKIPELIVACQDNIENAIQENRKIAQGLVVPDFESISFQEQLLNLSDNMLKRSGIQVIMDTSGLQEEWLQNEQKLVIYRIVQEQFTNIVKHAGAGLVYVLLCNTPDEFKMNIFDNGKGMETETKKEGIGLRNIRGRLAIFNGTVDIRTSPGKGFTMDVTIPLTI
ncbi:MAG TPA: response regulator [Puia sp.]|nr:response regulator [Puia sp.]